MDDSRFTVSGAWALELGGLKKDRSATDSGCASINAWSRIIGASSAGSTVMPGIALCRNRTYNPVRLRVTGCSALVTTAQSPFPSPCMRRGRDQPAKPQMTARKGRYVWPMKVSRKMAKMRSFPGSLFRRISSYFPSICTRRDSNTQSSDPCSEASIRRS